MKRGFTLIPAKTEFIPNTKQAARATEQYLNLLK